MFPFFQFKVHVGHADVQQRKSYSQWSAGYLWQRTALLTVYAVLCTVPQYFLLVLQLVLEERIDIFSKLLFVVEQELCYWI